MKNYRDQTPEESCGSCEHCYIKCEHGEELEYFCTNNDDTRPLMTVSEILNAGKHIRDINYSEREAWSDKYRVVPNGICDNYE